MLGKLREALGDSSLSPTAKLEAAQAAFQGATGGALSVTAQVHWEALQAVLDDGAASAEARLNALKLANYEASLKAYAAEVAGAAAVQCLAELAQLAADGGRSPEERLRAVRSRLREMGAGSGGAGGGRRLTMLRLMLTESRGSAEERLDGLADSLRCMELRAPLEDGRRSAEQRLVAVREVLKADAARAVEGAAAKDRATRIRDSAEERLALLKARLADGKESAEATLAEVRRVLTRGVPGAEERIKELQQILSNTSASGEERLSAMMDAVVEGSSGSEQRYESVRGSLLEAPGAAARSRLAAIREMLADSGADAEQRLTELRQLLEAQGASAEVRLQAVETYFKELAQRSMGETARKHLEALRKVMEDSTASAEARLSELMQLLLDGSASMKEAYGDRVAALGDIMREASTAGGAAARLAELQA